MDNSLPCGGYPSAYGGSIGGGGGVGDLGGGGLDDLVPTTAQNYQQQYLASVSGGGGSISGSVVGPATSYSGKEVHYAPLPNAVQQAPPSPTHSNPMSQAPLQRAHSRLV